LLGQQGLAGGPRLDHSSGVRGVFVVYLTGWDASVKQLDFAA
jgi:hypothetical protein